MRCLILSLTIGLLPAPPQAPPQAPQLAPPQAPLPRPPVVIPRKLPAGPAVQLVPCGTVVTRVSRTFRDGSHEHVCPNCGTRWVHGGRTGVAQSHVCPGTRRVLVSAAPPAPPSGSWSRPSSVSYPPAASG